MSNEVTRLRTSTEVQPAQPAANVSLPNTLQEAMAAIKDALTTMQPDDVSVELSASSEVNRTNCRLTFRAYKRRQIAEDRDV